MNLAFLTLPPAERRPTRLVKSSRRVGINSNPAHRQVIS